MGGVWDITKWEGHGIWEGYRIWGCGIWGGMGYGRVYQPRGNVTCAMGVRRACVGE